MTDPPDGVLVRATSLRVGYGARTVAECPDFEISRGDCVCIVGPNGSGKSTLLKTLAGLVPPCGGALHVAGGLLSGGAGYVPQHGPAAGDFPASVREVVMSGLQASRGWRPFYSAEERRAAARAMVRLGVAALARKPYRELSGGQRRRALLARAFCSASPLLLLDEPAAGLDEDGTSALCGSAEEACARGCAIVIVTHSAGAVARATRVIRLGEAPSFERGSRGA